MSASIPDLRAEWIRYIKEALAAGEHTDTVTGGTIVLDDVQKARVQEFVDRLVKDILDD